MLASAIVGGTSAEANSEDIQDNISEGAKPPPKLADASHYEIIGSLSGSKAEKPDWVSEIIEVRILYIYIVPELGKGVTWEYTIDSALF